MIKRIAIGLVAVVAGLGVGAGGAYVASRFLPHYAPGLMPGASKAKEETEFVPAGEVLAPLVFPDGRLAGYASFEIQLEVVKGHAEEVSAQLPLLLNAVNMRTYRAPLASGPDGMIPGVAQFRKVALESAIEVFGKDAVRSVAVTKATPS